MNLLLRYFQLLRAVVPHVTAPPAVVVFGRGWGVHHASFPRFIMGWMMGIPLTPVSALVPGPERADAALALEITRPWQCMDLFGMVSAAVFAVGRIRLAPRPPSGLSNDVGRVRFPPCGTFWQLVSWPGWVWRIMASGSSSAPFPPSERDDGVGLSESPPP
ncbi:MAG: hypothetical protein JWM59_17 [Verrucomicrobiales bacterium]|nr:hypothetical protein [Verrucomicrobiales bacterium]